MTTLTTYSTTEKLIEVLGLETGYAIGDHVAPGDTQTNPVDKERYIIVTRVPGGENPSPAMADMHRDLWTTYQLTTVCHTGHQAGRNAVDVAADKARAAILDMAYDAQGLSLGYRVDLDSTGVKVIGRVAGSHGDTILDDNAWIRHDRYRLLLTVDD